ncbi:MAG: DUF4832 domain-containing protein [Planctomycetes bacterium]|nr:DUF4832 domain-containing protein [Planctomycetota bacterium]
MARKSPGGSGRGKRTQGKISPDALIARILDFFKVFPGLARQVPPERLTKAFWKKTFASGPDARRMLELLRELPAFTNLAPKSRSRAAWERVLVPPTDPESFAVRLSQLASVSRRKTRRPGTVTRWRDKFGPNETVQRVRPGVSDEYIPNPHRGTTTFQRFQGDDTYPSYITSDTHGPVEFKSVKQVPDNVKYIPHTTLTYCRWPWRWLEPEKGGFRWDIVEKTLRIARERGQTAQLRFQPYTRRVEYSQEPAASRRHPKDRSVNVPDWYWDTGAAWIRRGTYAANEPDSNDPKYIRHFGDFIRAFARRFDGHPDLESIDIAYAGFWGESGGNTTTATAHKLADIYLRSFKKTQLLSMLGTPGSAHAAAVTADTSRHIGWRADCFGDLRRSTSPDVPPELGWNHTYDAYPMEIERNGLKDAWRTAPVTMETCGNVATWFLQDYDFDRIVEEGYNYHMSVFMPKNVFFPEAVMDKLVEFDKYIGYRFVLRQITLPLEAAPGDRVLLRFFIDNVGCAPIYRPYRLAVRFRQGRNSSVVRLGQDIRSWMPGHSWFEEKITVPSSLKRGEAKVDVGIVDDSNVPRVWFAVKGRLENGWHPMTGMDMRK